jgi:hypothetical protein
LYGGCINNRINYNYLLTERDKYVVAVLMALTHNCTGFSWSSDGENGDHKEGEELFNKYK